MSNLSESKRDRFVRIAETRTNKIISMIQLLSNCSNKNTYDYTDQDIQEIFRAIEDELTSCKQKFITKSENRSKKFKLSK